MAISIDNHSTQTTARSKPALSLKLFERRIEASDRMFFTEQLALMIDTGANLHEALRALREQCPNAAMRLVIDQVVTDIAGGRSFSDALRRHKQVFSPTYVNLVAAGENGGFLQQVLNQILEMDERRERLSATMKSAASYPVFLILFSLAVVVFVLLAVFPKFQSMFAAIANDLPSSTRFLMWTSDRLREDWLTILGGLGVLLCGLWRWSISDTGSMLLDRARLAVPGLRDVFVQLYLVQTLRVLSLSLGNGVSIMEALSACRDVVRNRVYTQLIVSMEASVNEGNGLAAGVRRVSFVPSVVKQMIETGEQSGKLPHVMGRIADYYERELEKRLQTISRLAEPVMLIVMGGVVGLLVSSLILPIFKLSRAVG